MIKVIGVRFKKAGKIYYFDPLQYTVEKDSAVIVETARGIEFGQCVVGIREISEKEIRMFFVRDFDYNPNQPIIFDADMALITGVGIGAFQPQQVGGYPMIHPLSFAGKNFYSEITSFIRFYKFQLFEETGQLVEHIGLRCYSDRILMQIIF